MWMNCHGALIANYGLPDTAGEYAAKGTILHSITEEWLVTGNRPDYMLGTRASAEAGGVTYVFIIDAEMLQAAEDCVVRVADIPGERFYETRVLYDDLTPIPNQGGTCDFSSCEPGVLHIRDWKFGVGVKVFVENNSQLLLYAYGMFRKMDWLYNFQRITLGIYQPLLAHFDEWEVSREELLAFTEKAKYAAHESWKPNAPRTPSPKACQWCKVKNCAARNAVSLANLAGTVDDEPDSLDSDASHQMLEQAEQQWTVETRNAWEMSEDRLLWIKRNKKLILKTVEDAESELLRRARLGAKFEGLKLVQGVTRAQFSTEEEAIWLLEELGVPRDAMYKRSLVTPPQAADLVRQYGPERSPGKKMSKEKARSLIRSIEVQPPGDDTLVFEKGDDREEAPSLLDTVDLGDDDEDFGSTL